MLGIHDVGTEFAQVVPKERTGHKYAGIGLKAKKRTSNSTIERLEQSLSRRFKKTNMQHQSHSRKHIDVLRGSRTDLSKPDPPTDESDHEEGRGNAFRGRKDKQIVHMTAAETKAALLQPKGHGVRKKKK